MKTVALIVPCYNEQDNIEIFIKTVDAELVELLPNYNFKIIAINDGSHDNTLDILYLLKQKYNYIQIVDFSRNFGKEAAISAGLFYANADAVVPIDADLQHPIGTILEMLKLWEDGYEVVLARRVNRDTDHAVQKATAKLFYKAHNAMSDVTIPADVGDFRLMDKKVVNALNSLPENRRFMKGLFAWVGFKTATIEYEVMPRLNGVSKFNTWKLWNFALEGITSFSTAPLRIWMYIGGVVSVVSFLYALYLIVKTIIFGADIAGYASLMVSILFMGGIQLVSIGILGEYIGRVYLEAKRRPPYVIRSFTA